MAGVPSQKTKPWRALMLCALLPLAACEPAPTASLPSAITANTAATPAKLGLCAGCHGSNGKAILPTYPNLQGQNQQYLEKSLRAYRSGERSSAEMRSMVGTLTDADIVALSAYYSAQ
jgi:cytochrome c553